MIALAGFRTECLQRELTSAEVAEIKRRRADGEYGLVHGYFRGVAPSLIMSGVAVLALSAFMRPFLLAGSIKLAPKALLWAWAAGLIFFLISVVRIAITMAREQGKWVKMAQFADDNKLQFRGRSDSPSYPGLIFNLGSDRASREHIHSPDGPFADAGAYTYVMQAGNQRQRFSWQFAAFRLPAPMPHLVLDSKANNHRSGTNLPANFGPSQRLSLGAPFDDRFTLYAPEGYSQDALYLFPPNVLEQLLEIPVNYDIEIVDNWMFLYTRSGQDLTEAATWETFEQITDLITRRMSPVAERYRDRRAEEANPAPLNSPQGNPGRPQIAAPGQRLRTQPHWIAAMVLFTIFFVLVLLVSGFIPAILNR